HFFRGAVFVAPSAVLAVPIAPGPFPAPPARAKAPERLGGEGGGRPPRSQQSGTSFDDTSATSTRAVTVASWLGVAAMAGTCIPLARGFQSHASQAADARQLGIALAAFAAGLGGYGLSANLSRVA